MPYCNSAEGAGAGPREEQARRQVAEEVFGRLLFFLGPLHQQPGLLVRRMHLATGMSFGSGRDRHELPVKAKRLRGRQL
jgi:hypothetical protein